MRLKGRGMGVSRLSRRDERNVMGKNCILKGEGRGDEYTSKQARWD